MQNLSFTVKKEAKKSRARLGIIEVAHGKIETPYFVPVATAATVRGLDQMDMEELRAQVLLANTYHLHLRPGDKNVKKLGGLHRFMNWNKPLFTDSGGFQAFSLGYGMEHNINKLGNIFPENKKTKTEDIKEKFATINDKGVTFKAHHSGEIIHLNPKKSIEIQQNLGADIILAFDECTSPLSSKEYTKTAMERTHRWAIESLKFHKKKAKKTKQALYGIIQGGEYRDLRDESTRFITSLDFDGIAIGGSLGKSKNDMHNILDWVIPSLPKNKPRHLLGIGDIDDIFIAVEKGIDTFDCVYPTRIARRGTLLVTPEEGGSLKNKFRLNIGNAKFKLDKKPVDRTCTCSTCRNYSRAYLNHLYKTKELAYFKLAALHNVHFMLNLMERIREAIRNDSLHKLKKKWLG